MIIAKSILGRLGNQMFQYAYCKAIKEAVGGSLAFSFDKVYRQKEVGKNPEGFEDSLRFFNVDENGFTLKQPRLECNKGLYEIIEANNTVCISIRRGDFLNPQYADQFYICDETYIKRAIDKVKQLIDKPVLVFFSDDIKWVKGTIKTDLPAYYESGNDPVWEKLRLIYSCKHFIISNSTFSWWAQYLSRNTNKIVISPDRWFNDEKKDTHLISDDFITIPCGKS